jgi:hypothetical protein
MVRESMPVQTPFVLPANASAFPLREGRYAAPSFPSITWGSCGLIPSVCAGFSQIAPLSAGKIHKNKDDDNVKTR